MEKSSIPPYFSKYSDVTQDIRVRVRTALASLVVKALGEEFAKEVLSQLPSLDYSLLLHFPLWVSEGTTVNADAARCIAEANYWLSVINAVVDPILDESDGRHAFLLPLTYIAFQNASDIYEDLLRFERVPASTWRDAFLVNMVALTREASQIAYKKLTAYSEVAQNCRVLEPSWLLLVPETTRARYPQLLEQFLITHKMFDDLHDLANDTAQNTFSLLRAQIEYGEQSGVNVVQNHCDLLVTLLTEIGAHFNDLGMHSLADFLADRERRTLHERAFNSWVAAAPGDERRAISGPV